MKKESSAGSRYYVLIAACLVCLALAAGAWWLRLQAGRLEARQRLGVAQLKESVPDFDSQTIGKFKKSTAALENKVMVLSAIFDPRYKWMKENYDYSIYFIEELGVVGTFLKTKSQAKHVSCPDLGFKERLPSEQEALYLLSQLNAIKETVSLGMDYGITFKAVTPMGTVDSKMPGIRYIKSRFEMTCPPEALMDFIIQLNEVVPKVCFSSLSVKSGEGAFDVDITVEQVIIDSDVPGQRQEPSASQVRAFAGASDADFVHVLRSNNPFLVPAPLAVEEGLEPAAAPQQPKPRFIFRGKARKQSRQVVVIEDTLKDETLFVGLEETIDHFKLVDFSDDAIVLKNTDDNHELIIKREE